MHDIKSYARNRSIELLRDDINFIDRITKGMTRSLRQSVILRYFDTWNAAMHSVNAVNRQNQGRFAANTFLRKYKEEMNK